MPLYNSTAAGHGWKKFNQCYLACKTMLANWILAKKNESE